MPYGLVVPNVDTAPPVSGYKVADLIPQPTPLVSREVRDALAHLTGTYALEDEGD